MISYFVGRHLNKRQSGSWPLCLTSAKGERGLVLLRLSDERMYNKRITLLGGKLALQDLGG